MIKVCLFGVEIVSWVPHGGLKRDLEKARSCRYAQDYMKLYVGNLALRPLKRLQVFRKHGKVTEGALIMDRPPAARAALRRLLSDTTKPTRCCALNARKCKAAPDSQSAASE